MATISSSTRDARLDFRLSQDHKRMIEQAAAVTGQSLSEFALANLVQAAQRVIERAAVTELTTRDRDTFLRLIASDAKPNKALQDAASRYRKRRG